MKVFSLTGNRQLKLKSYFLKLFLLTLICVNIFSIFKPMPTFPLVMNYAMYGSGPYYRGKIAINKLILENHRNSQTVDITDYFSFGGYDRIVKVFDLGLHYKTISHPQEYMTHLRKMLLASELAAKLNIVDFSNWHLKIVKFEPTPDKENELRCVNIKTVPITSVHCIDVKSGQPCR